MIHAIVRNGVIQPTEPLPSHWTEGHEVQVDDALAEQGSQDQDAGEAHWAEDMDALTAPLNNEQEWSAIEERLANADQEAKNLVRREMQGADAARLYGDYDAAGVDLSLLRWFLSFSPRQRLEWMEKCARDTQVLYEYGRRHRQAKLAQDR